MMGETRTWRLGVPKVGLVCVFVALWVPAAFAQQRRQVVVMDERGSDEPVLVSASGWIRSAQLYVKAALSKDAPYATCVHFSLDGVGGWLNVAGKGSGQYRGPGEILPGQTRSWTYDLASCPVALDHGQRRVDFLAMLKSPGYHKVVCFVGSPTWGKVTLHIDHQGGTVELLTGQPRGLKVPLVGSWDFRIQHVGVSKRNLTTGQLLEISTQVLCKRGTPTGNRAKVVCIVSKPDGFRCSTSKEVDVGSAGTATQVMFQFVPEEPGAYTADVEVWGGAGNLWRFDATADADLSKRPRFSVRWGTDGFRPLEPNKKGHFTYYTFQFGPQVVNAIADDRQAAERYARRMVWFIAGQRFHAGEGTVLALALGIAVTSENLHAVARSHRGQTIFYQLKFDDRAAQVVEAVQLIRNALAAARLMANHRLLELPVQPVTLK